jgi:hypothetical protein
MIGGDLLEPLPHRLDRLMSQPRRGLSIAADTVARTRPMVNVPDIHST